MVPAIERDPLWFASSSLRLVLLRLSLVDPGPSCERASSSQNLHQYQTPTKVHDIDHHRRHHSLASSGVASSPDLSFSVILMLQVSCFPVLLRR